MTPYRNGSPKRRSKLAPKVTDAATPTTIDVMPMTEPRSAAAVFERRERMPFAGRLPRSGWRVAASDSTHGDGSSSVRRPRHGQRRAPHPAHPTTKIATPTAMTVQSATTPGCGSTTRTKPTGNNPGRGDRDRPRREPRRRRWGRVLSPWPRCSSCRGEPDRREALSLVVARPHLTADHCPTAMMPAMPVVIASSQSPRACVATARRTVSLTTLSPESTLSDSLSASVSNSARIEPMSVSGSRSMAIIVRAIPTFGSSSNAGDTKAMGVGSSSREESRSPRPT